MSRHDRSPKNSHRISLLAILGNLGWPLLLGLAATSLFFALVYRGPLNTPTMHRYFASHPVTFFETGLFFVGLAALGLKLLEVASQFFALRDVRLSDAPEGGNAIDDCERLRGELEQLPATAQRSHLTRRLREALDHLSRTGAATQLGDELKYLADVESARQQESYGLVRIVIWATPMLGFLGTVMGITEALGDLSANAKLLATSIDTAIQGLLGGLYVAFDTTALALTLSMILMFIQFMIDRVEQQLLTAVDGRANESLMGRFQGTSTSNDPAVAAIERVAHAMLRATEQLVQRQAQVWQGTIESAHQEWQGLYDTAGEQLRASLAAAMGDAVRDSLRVHTEQIASLDAAFARPLVEQWEKVEQGLDRQTDKLREHSTQLQAQTEILARAITATGDVLRLEKALNGNLAALAESRNFEDTVMSLSAAIHLLTTRLGKAGDAASPAAAGAVELTGMSEKQAQRGKAA